MDEAEQNGTIGEMENKAVEITYSPDKDFYRGISGELRYKAEGLFKKAKEKGISIEEITIERLRDNRADFPGIGELELPTYMVKVRGRDIQSGQVIADGKQIDYYNRYQKYLAERIESKNAMRDARGKIVRDRGRTIAKENPEMELTEWERFEIGKSLVEDKEFGLEKTITGACDRIIRKLMGENDWLYPEEARLLEEEFTTVQNAVAKEQESRKQHASANPPGYKKATERQINFLKAKLKNAGLNPEDPKILKEVAKQAGYGIMELEDLSTAGMSKIIDGLADLVPKIKNVIDRENAGKGDMGLN